MAIYIRSGALVFPDLPVGKEALLSSPAPPGYFTGFIFATLSASYFLKKHDIALFSFMLFANFWLSLFKGKTVGFAQFLTMGTISFITGNIARVIARAAGNLDKLIMER